MLKLFRDLLTHLLTYLLVRLKDRICTPGPKDRIYTPGPKDRKYTPLELKLKNIYQGKRLQTKPFGLSGNFIVSQLY